ncbi:TPA: hypothetical protein PTV74_002186 [Clostridium botulinum]|uniref:hypothetical protein n=1 Tax=Clostridium botulinum TaxID=1491 RepID=UPI000D0DE387|nr:hypothetical protein [Clostridium botulinum]PSL97560.1 hypothetical protein C6C12_15495 [Clostridium botulinum]HDK7138318.1 hypothetical protein [Clostridium botulinum]HDK7141646.1 hypothetical protein [Clostridium botulinum]HDK7145469.1 hypothetical protein [Clostridium botulinum]HDK7149121.1 hypothetical protein [Clostridium botulinum]
MATIGEQLLQPESGWIRYDDTDKNISYIGNGWKTDHDSHYSNTVGDKICFNFVGSKIRILVFTNNSHSKDVKIKINNTVYSYVEYIHPITPASLVLIFGKEMTSFKEYSVEIYIEKQDNEYGWFDLDAIDIDENGILKPYNPSLNKFLLKQNNQYYTIKSEFYKNSNYEPIADLQKKEILTQTDFETYGIDDLNLLTKTVDTQNINGTDKGRLGNGKLFEFEMDSNHKKMINQPKFDTEVEVTNSAWLNQAKFPLASGGIYQYFNFELKEDYYSRFDINFTYTATSQYIIYYTDGTKNTVFGDNNDIYNFKNSVLDKTKQCKRISFRSDVSSGSFLSFKIFKEYKLKFLIQYKSQLYTFDGTNIVLLPSQELDENNFINNGFIDATAIGKGQWNIAFPDKSNLKLLMWTDDMSKTDVSLETEIIPFRPIDKLKKNSDICNILFKEV